ncbi:MAG: sulfatase-like hydrolase/transferase [Chromatiales bacterium]|nr:sulfatase-like hydrolase/transferase [Chromatiales bacterium]
MNHIRLCTFGCLVALLIGLSNETRAAERPTILFIYTDDQSHRTVSCYPEAFDWVKTPHIDSLAKQGVRFSHAYIGAWCMPSRASMLTGHHQHGIESMRMEGTYPGSAYDPDKCPFWPKVFRENGYTTAQIGNATIDTAHVTGNLSASRLEAGTIDASQISIVGAPATLNIASAASGARMVIEADSIKVYDAVRLRVVLGNLG